MNRQMISQLTPSQMGIPLYRLSPTVEIYFRGQMEEGYMQLRNPPKSIFYLQPQSPNMILISSQLQVTLFSSSKSAMCLRVTMSSPLERQLKSESGWKSCRVVIAQRYAWSQFSCCSMMPKYPQTPANIQFSLNYCGFLLAAGCITTIILYFSQLSYTDPHLLMHKSYHFQFPQKTLIINADDFGLHPRFDQAILELAKQRKITSFSAIVNAKNIQQAALKYHESLQEGLNTVSLGLHFNLTQFQPLSQQIKKSKIVKDGKFLGKPGFYEAISIPLAFTQQQIAQQLQAQIKRFIFLFKRRPSHLDGHNHVHVVPQIAKIVSQVMSQNGIYRVRIPNQNLKGISIPMNQIFLKNAKESAKIYDQQLIQYPSQFIGLEMFGKLRVQPIIQQIISYENESTLQLMCHPGHSVIQGNEWITSSIHQNEMQQLCSQEFKSLASYLRFSSYHDLPSKISQKPNRMLIYSKMLRGSGNYTTSIRYKSLFSSLGFEVFLYSVEDFIDVDKEAQDMEQFLLRFKISLILGVNITRSAGVLYQATRKIAVPYILVVAGTDANITFQQKQKLKSYIQPLKSCLCLVSLSRSMLSITQNTLVELKIIKNIYCCPQSSTLSSVVNQDINFDKPFILLPTSFRQVKAVDFLMQQLNKIIQKHSIDVIIVGPIINHAYYHKCIEKLGKIKYLGNLSRDVYMKYLKQAFVMINTSESEGMSCSILQALQLGTPVIVRNNPGNVQLVNHGHNGFVFTTPEQFTSFFIQLRQNPILRQQMIENGQRQFTQKYSFSFEKQHFQKMLLKQFYSRTMISFEKDSMIKVFNQDHVHHTSQINNQLLSSMKPDLTKDLITVLDLGCGSGIFSLHFLNRHASNTHLYLSDISKQIVSSALYNLIQSKLPSRITKITCIQSDLFEKIDPSLRFDYILFNPPQTPFRLASSRLDKNGGKDAFKFYPPILSYIAACQNTQLYILHSFMAWPQRLAKYLKEKNLKISWKSQKKVHKIGMQTYNQMQQHLSSYIMEHAYKGRAEISFQSGNFSVPAIVYCIDKE